MSNGDIKIEGEPSKRFRVWSTDINREPYKCEGEYDTVEEVMAHRRRLRRDRNYKIEVRRKFMALSEFDEWVKKQ